jgi:GNAT superfamily N-acetyltransferase
MTEIAVRVLEESEWALYRDVRLRALSESPDSFTATLADEADRDEQFWRDRMTRSYWLVAERDAVPQGIVSLGPYEQDPSAAEVFGLYVVPDARGTGVAGDSLRLRRLWQPSRVTCSSTTGSGPTMPERSASVRTSASAPLATAAHHAARTCNGARRRLR